MYGLPSDFDAQMLVGRTLDQICVALNQVSLHFEGDVHITVEGPYVYRAQDASVEAEGQGSRLTDAAKLVELVGDTVAGATASSDGTLVVVLQKGQSLTLLDRPHYESYHIRFGQRVITV